VSSIFELFGDPSLQDEDGGAVFDPSNLDKVLDQVIANRPVAGRPDGFAPGAPGSAVPQPDGETGTEGGDPGPPASVPPEAPPASPPAAETPPAVPADPLGNLNEMERLELSQLRQALSDPERALAVRRAMLGVEAPPVTAAPTPAAPVAATPTLPEEIDPGSFEAQLWHQNQEMQRQLAEIKAGQQATTEQTEQQIIGQAARTATSNFATRYAGKLSKEEIEAVCQHAGLQKLPEAFRPVSASWEEAMDKALEFTVRSNDGLLAKVLGMQPVIADPNQRSPEAMSTARKLTALSSAASPSGEAAQRTPIEHRGDGRLSEKSRLALVQEMMSGGSITGSPGEGI
jgi:hypothetical protein